MTCKHERFECRANVNRLTHVLGITGYCVDITVKCVVCGTPFQFLGLPAGSHPSKPTVSLDGTELRAPIAPALIA